MLLASYAMLRRRTLYNWFKSNSKKLRVVILLWVKLATNIERVTNKLVIICQGETLSCNISTLFYI